MIIVQELSTHSVGLNLVSHSMSMLMSAATNALNDGVSDCDGNSSYNSSVLSAQSSPSKIDSTFKIREVSFFSLSF